jgi:hypothetical protein
MGYTHAVVLLYVNDPLSLGIFAMTLGYKLILRNERLFKVKRHSKEISEFKAILNLNKQE